LNHLFSDAVLIVGIVSQCIVTAFPAVWYIIKQELYLPTYNLHYLHGPLHSERRLAPAARGCIPMYRFVTFRDVVGVEIEACDLLVWGASGKSEVLETQRFD
jgi:hypothetical protein